MELQGWSRGSVSTDIVIKPAGSPGRLFDRACRLMADGIRHQHPALDDAGVNALIAERLDRLRRLETV